MVAEQRFSPAFLAEVRARTPLVALVGRDVRLARKGDLWQGLCPFHGERRPSFAVYPDHYHCFGCGVHGDAVSYIMARRNVTFADAVTELAVEAGMVSASDAAPRKPLQPAQAPRPDQAPQKHDEALRMWLEAKPEIFDTPVEDYLKNRKIDLRPLGRAPRALRFHPALYHAGVRARLPAMVAAINLNGQHVATHRTWLERTGGGWIKARIADNKMVLGAFAGGSIHLWRGASEKPLKDAPPGERVFIAEGIESALSVAVALPELRVLAAVSQGNLGGIILPPQTGAVILGIDNDEKQAARAAFERVINRWFDRGLGKNLGFARSPAGNDFNDALQAGNMEKAMESIRLAVLGYDVPFYIQTKGAA